jgi:hypothetical protein
MKHFIIVFIYLLFASFGRAQKVFNIWPGIAPGSEKW